MPGMKRKNMMGKDMPMMRGGGNMTMKRGGMAKKKTVKKKTKKKAKKRQLTQSHLFLGVALY